MIEKTTYYHCLSNGVRIVFRPNLSGIVYCGIAVGAGSRDEDSASHGMAHFIEHTLFKGTTRRTARQIINRIEDVGGEINAYTTKEETFYYAAVLPQYLERATELISDMLVNPSFPEKELKKEKEVIYDEIESYNDSPSDLIYDDFEALMYEGHNLEHPILGAKKTIRHFHYDQAIAFMQANYTPDRIVFFVQGNVKWEKVQRLAERYFSDIPYASKSNERVKPASYQPQQAEFKKHTHQIHLMLGSRAYEIGHPRQNTMFLLNNILGGGGMKSLLNLALREQRGLVYNVESTYSPMSDTGYWSVYFACEAANAQLCLDLTLLKFKQLMEHEFSPTTLNKYKKQLLGQMSVGDENQENSALSMAKYMLYYNNAPTMQQIYEQISQITPEELKNVANEMFKTENLTILKYK